MYYVRLTHRCINRFKDYGQSDIKCYMFAQNLWTIKCNCHLASRLITWNNEWKGVVHVLCAEGSSLLGEDEDEIENGRAGGSLSHHVILLPLPSFLTGR